MRAADWDRAYGAAALEWDVAPHPVVAEHVADLPPGDAVELGCGEGRQAIWLAAHGWRMSAVDYSPVAVDRARTLAAHHGVPVDFAVADVRDWALPACDLVLVLYLHDAGFATALERAVAALRPDGTLLVLGWDEDNAAGPANRYSVPTLTAAADGLAVVRAERVPQVGSADAHDALLVARRNA